MQLFIFHVKVIFGIVSNITKFKITEVLASENMVAIV